MNAYAEGIYHVGARYLPSVRDGTNSMSLCVRGTRFGGFLAGTQRGAIPSLPDDDGFVVRNASFNPVPLAVFAGSRIFRTLDFHGFL